MARKRKPPKRKDNLLHEAPTCNCLLLCDDVMTSTCNGKQILQGVIDIFNVREFPGTIGKTVAYIRLSNVYASQDVSVDLIHGGNDESLFEFKITSPRETDPLGVYTLIIPIPPFVVREAGRYVLRVLSSGGVPLAQSPLVVRGPSQEHGS